MHIYTHIDELLLRVMANVLYTCILVYAYTQMVPCRYIKSVSYTHTCVTYIQSPNGFVYGSPLVDSRSSAFLHLETIRIHLPKCD